MTLQKTSDDIGKDILCKSHLQSISFQAAKHDNANTPLPAGTTCRIGIVPPPALTQKTVMRQA